MGKNTQDSNRNIDITTGPSDAIERIRQLVGGSCPQEVADRAIAIILGCSCEEDPV